MKDSISESAHFKKKFRIFSKGMALLQVASLNLTKNYHQKMH